MSRITAHWNNLNLKCGEIFMSKSVLRTLPYRLDLKTYTSGQISIIETDSGEDMPIAILKADEREGIDPRAMGARIVACVNAMEGIDDPAAARVILDEPQTQHATDMLEVLHALVGAGQYDAGDGRCKLSTFDVVLMARYVLNKMEGKK